MKSSAEKQKALRKHRKKARQKLKRLAPPDAILDVTRDQKRTHFGARKLSDTLHEYATPLLAVMGVPGSGEILSEILTLAVGIWNFATVPAGFDGERQELREALTTVMSNRLELSRDEAGDLLTALIQRRRVEFALAPYAFGPISVTETSRGLYQFTVAAELHVREL